MYRTLQIIQLTWQDIDENLKSYKK